MKPWIAIGLLMAALALTGCGGKSTGDPMRSAQDGREEVDFSALPPAGDRDALTVLNRRQRRILRTAERACSSGVDGSMSARACIIGRADLAVSQENDPALLAFHYALPMQHRYDTNRPTSVWINVHRYVATPETP